MFERLRDRCRPLGRALLGAALAVNLGGCAMYHSVDANFRELRETGRHGVRLQFGKSEARELGRIRAVERSWIFGSCDALGMDALDELAETAAVRGADLVSDLRFRGKWRWLEEPVCRRNFTWSFLVFPILLPIPLSVEVSGEARATQDAATAAR